MTTKRAAIYCRVSTRGQEEEGTSLETQEAECCGHAAKLGYDVRGIYREVHSGFQLHERPRLQALREAVLGGNVDAVIVYAVDRLSRRQAHLAIIADELERAGVALFFVTEEFDKSAVGEFIRAAKAFAAEVEREKLRERTARARQAIVEKGRLPTWCFAPYGYTFDRERGHRLVNEDEAAVVRDLYQMVADGVSLCALTKRLNERGIPSSGASRIGFKDGRSPKWHRASIRRLLRNPAYKGLSFAYRFKRESKQRQITLPEEKWVKLEGDQTPAIVSEELWEIANKRLKENKGAATRNERRPFLLRGRIICPTCHKPLYPERTKTKSYSAVYRCVKRQEGCERPGRAPVEPIEAWAWEVVRGIIDDPEGTVAEVCARHGAGPDRIAIAERERVERQVKQLERKQLNLISRLSEVDTDNASIAEHIMEQHAKYEQTKLEQQARLAELDRQIAEARAATPDPDRLTAFLRAVRRRAADGSEFDRRVAALDALDVRVEARGRVWELSWAAPALNPGGERDKGIEWSVDMTGVEEGRGLDHFRPGPVGGSERPWGRPPGGEKWGRIGEGRGRVGNGINRVVRRRAG